jgi:glycosyltransferase involved in cell wall biosynthesis
VAHILYDGLNLQLEHGTGVATYGRTLVAAARDLGHRTSIAYSYPGRVPSDPQLLEAVFFEHGRAKSSVRAQARRWLRRRLHRTSTAVAHPVPISGMVLLDPIRGGLAGADVSLIAEDLFGRAADHFRRTGRFLALTCDPRPDIAHFTFPVPITVPGAKNLYTIHDLVPLRLPYASLEDRGHYLRLVRAVAEQADRIVTVSECSKHDISSVLGLAAHHITNTHQTADLPADLLSRPLQACCDEIEGLFGLLHRKYFLFPGAMEPKKNVLRLLEAFLSAKVDVPLVFVGSKGWRQEREFAMIRAEERSASRNSDGRGGPRLRHLGYVSRRVLVSLLRCARGVVFPSLYEGFGLPVLEAMALGTPVLTSNTSALAEVAGGAALSVDPVDIDALRDGIRRLASDESLCAELSERGLQQAGLFAPDIYRERLKALYETL